jgi:3-dehydroquinate synthase
MRPLRAVILAGGRGHRLDKYRTPKPLVRVGGRTLLSRMVGMLQTAGVEDISILIQEDDTSIESFIIKKFGEQNGVRIFKPNVSTKNEKEALLSIPQDDAKDTLITACDLVFEKNPFHEFIRQAVRSKNISALVSIDRASFEKSGAKVKSLCTKETIEAVGAVITHSDSMLVGTYVFSPEAFSDFCKLGKKNDDTEYTDSLFSRFAKEGRLIPHTIGKNEWYDINTPDILLRAELLEQRLIADRFKVPFLDSFKQRDSFKSTATFYNRKKQRSDILVERGILKNLSERDILPQEYIKSPHFIITDKQVNALYGERLQKDLQKKGWTIDKIVIEEGEGVKAIDTYVILAQELLERSIDKRSIIISLGGGVVNNIAGFLAATIYRGIGLVHIPTTLLAQNDAAIGIKQGVNGPKGKNLIGAKYSPMRIIVDPDVLQTLTERQLKDGLNECIKHALAQDKSFYSFLEGYKGPLADLDFLENIVKRNIDLKIKLMQNDFDEEREALVLLYGHEVGHAIEYLSGFTYGHGEAIAVGMRVSIEIANILGIASKATVHAHKTLFKKYKISTTIPKSITPEAIMDMLRFDKKFHGGDVYFSLSQ